MLIPAKVSRLLAFIFVFVFSGRPRNSQGGGGRPLGEGIAVSGKRGGYYRFPTNDLCPFVNVLQPGTEPKPVMDDRHVMIDLKLMGDFLGEP